MKLDNTIYPRPVPAKLLHTFVIRKDEHELEYVEVRAADGYIELNHLIKGLDKNMLHTADKIRLKADEFKEIAAHVLGV